MTPNWAFLRLNRLLFFSSMNPNLLFLSLVRQMSLMPTERCTRHRANERTKRRTSRIVRRTNSVVPLTAVISEKERTRMIKASVFAGKKGPLGNACGTPVSISGTSSSLFDSSLQQHIPTGSSRNWQGTPTSTRRLPPAFHQHLLQPSNSSTSIRSHPMVPTSIASNTPNTSIINRAKPCTLPGLVESLNEVEALDFSLLISLSRFLTF